MNEFPLAGRVLKVARVMPVKSATTDINAAVAAAAALAQKKGPCWVASSHHLV